MPPVVRGRECSRRNIFCFVLVKSCPLQLRSKLPSISFVYVCNRAQVKDSVLHGKEKAALQKDCDSEMKSTTIALSLLHRMCSWDYLMLLIFLCQDPSHFTAPSNETITSLPHRPLKGCIVPQMEYTASSVKNIQGTQR